MEVDASVERVISSVTLFFSIVIGADNAISVSPSPSQSHSRCKLQWGKIRVAHRLTRPRTQATRDRRQYCSLLVIVADRTIFPVVGDDAFG